MAFARFVYDTSFGQSELRSHPAGSSGPLSRLHASFVLRAGEPLLGDFLDTITRSSIFVAQSRT